ncbi:hypothetical protein TWF730_010077 [Orbilia blumenaviensis]|uniref:Uncharacterized protein n=1 Tax=Orbilia blumenaviensis TaxID=1796055 RepID=A0AAV9UUD4_9PEZI
MSPVLYSLRRRLASPFLDALSSTWNLSDLFHTRHHSHNDPDPSGQQSPKTTIPGDSDDTEATGSRSVVRDVFIIVAVMIGLCLISAVVEGAKRTARSKNINMNQESSDELGTVDITSVAATETGDVIVGTTKETSGDRPPPYASAAGEPPAYSEYST